MTIKQIKTHVKQSFIDVDSEDFLKLQIKDGVRRHKEHFAVWQVNNPHGTCQLWKNINEKAVNLNAINKEEIMAIGIFLLALDEFNP